MMNQLKALPLWVKQVLYIGLQTEFRSYFASESLLDISQEDTLSLFIPQTTTKAAECDNPTSLDPALRTILQAATQGLTVLDICLNHQWTLEQACLCLHGAIEENWIHPPESPKAYATLEYIASKIRLGEYLVKMGCITPQQLDQSLRTQIYIKEAMNEHTGIANIMINLGYITRKDTESILFLKEESKKPITALPLLSSPTA